MLIYIATPCLYLKKLADSILQCLIFKIFLGGMPPDLPSISMLHMHADCVSHNVSKK